MSRVWTLVGVHLQQPEAPAQGSPCVRCFVSESVSCCIALYSRPVSNGTPQAESIQELANRVAVTDLRRTPGPQLSEGD